MGTFGFRQAYKSSPTTRPSTWQPSVVSRKNNLIGSLRHREKRLTTSTSTMNAPYLCRLHIGLSLFLSLFLSLLLSLPVCTHNQQPTSSMYRGYQQRPPLGQRQQQIVLPDVADMGTLVVRGVTSFARRNRVLTGSYLFGIVVLLFMGAGTQLTLQQRREYNRIMNTIDLRGEYAASERYARAYQN